MFDLSRRNIPAAEPSEMLAVDGPLGDSVSVLGLALIRQGIVVQMAEVERFTELVEEEQLFVEPDVRTHRVIGHQRMNLSSAGRDTP